MTTEDNKREIQRRLLSDFPFYADKALKIRTKEGSIVPFHLNDQQRRLNETIEQDIRTKGHARVIILKARQLGMSTFSAGYMTHKVTNGRGKLAMVVSHVSDSTDALFGMTQRMYNMLPAPIKPSTKFASRRELYFDKLDSRYIVGTAGSAGLGRSQTIQYLHGSEVAFWPKTTAKETFNGLAQAVPNGNGSAIILESTANGTSGLFYEMWHAAVRGENGYTPVFFPWNEFDEYRRPVPEGFERTPEEEELVEVYGLDDEQLCFRREKIGLNGYNQFLQEYPLTPEEAFVSTGMQVFSPDKLQEQEQKCKPPQYTKMLFGEQWEDRRGGPLHVFEEWHPGESYIIGADSSMGIRGGDPSFAVVLDSQKRVVATYQDYVHPDHFATILTSLGYLYNTAFLIVESNAHGLLVCTRIFKDNSYANFYTEQHLDKMADQWTTKLGFTTTPKSKPLVIDKLRAEIRDDKIKINCRRLVKDLKGFVATPEGKYEADGGSHDDGVIALALANHAFTEVRMMPEDQEEYLHEAL